MESETGRRRAVRTALGSRKVNCVPGLGAKMTRITLVLQAYSRPTHYRQLQAVFRILAVFISF